MITRLRNGQDDRFRLAVTPTLRSRRTSHPSNTLWHLGTAPHPCLEVRTVRPAREGHGRRRAGPTLRDRGGCLDGLTGRQRASPSWIFVHVAVSRSLRVANVRTTACWRRRSMTSLPKGRVVSEGEGRGTGFRMGARGVEERREEASGPSEGGGGGPVRARTRRGG